MTAGRRVAADLAFVARFAALVVAVVAVATVSAITDGWLAMVLLTSAAFAPMIWALRSPVASYKRAASSPRIRVVIAPRVAPLLPAARSEVPLQLVAPVSPPFSPVESRLH